MMAFAILCLILYTYDTEIALIYRGMRENTFSGMEKYNLLGKQ